MSGKILENGLLYGLEMPSSYTTLEDESVKTLKEVLEDYPKASRLFDMLQTDPEVKTLFNLANFIAVRKLGYNDHGPIHAKIVAANGMRLVRLVLDSGGKVELDSISGLGMTEDDAHLIVLAGCILHDTGNAVHRIEHEMFSVMYGKSILERLLPEIYPDISERTAIIQQVLHTLYAHDVGENALTIEAAIVVIADGCDITKGRGRLAYDLGKHDIHSISALSIESVNITKGKEKLIEINVKMSNSAGIYQLQETLGKKVAESPLKDHIEIVAELVPSKAKPDFKVFDRIVFSDGKYKNA
ncbi:MAG: HD domain-containing protein [Candidatus Thermoplasmatota archaeon]|nr:HD domain-containing protein [Candidatus Thermoplasmatota archaeon]